MTRLIATLLVVLLLAANALAASSLLDYQQRVSRAGEELERMRHSSAGDNNIGYIKSLIPRSEQVEMQGQTIPVDNNWLYALLDSYEAESDQQKQEAKLHEAYERLYALDEHLQLALEAESEDGEQQRAKIREILARREYQEKSESPLTKLIKKVRQQIIDLIRNIYTKLINALFGQGAQASWLFRGLIVAGLGLVLIIVVRAIWRFKRPKKRAKKRIVLGEEIESDVTSSDLADSAVAAARSGDFRLAIRKLYISLLYELAERNLLELEPDATNRQYLAKVSRFTTIASPMRYLTDRFDYVWYGMFPSSEEDFSTCLARYKEVVDQAKNLGGQSAAAG